ncbi:MAG: hypothetical protein Kow0063_17300 [Anaerolineae bacterium]
MSILSRLALILLTLAGYSSGSVLGARRRTPVPGILDLLVIIGLWVGALATQNMLGKWLAVAVWLVIGLLVGGALARMRLAGYARAQRPGTGDGLWNIWKGFARRMGNYQSRVLMALIYFIVVLPFGLGVRLLADPLNVRRVKGGSNWQPKELRIKPSIEEAREQF